MKIPLYVATNLLETMINFSQPTRAESHDIYATLKQGATGLVLAAETAIGKYPLDSIKFLKKCILAKKNNQI
jgi:pyruvate kinase